MGSQHPQRTTQGETAMALDGILPFTRSLIQQVVQEGDTVVDATMGNGRDTLFLAQLVGPLGRVLAYDIQEEALRNTYERLQEANCLEQVQLFLRGHEHLGEDLQSIATPISAAMFNLGYLPGGNKEIVTKPETTIQALHGLRAHLKVGGIMTLVVYSGHEQGKLEKEKLLEEVSSWDQKEYDVLQYRFINQQNDPPFLIAIQRKK